MTTILLATMLLLRPTAPTPLGRAIEHVESRGNTFAVSPVGARGLWQVMPSVARVPVWLLHVPAVGRAEGRRVLGRWLRRCHGDQVCALRAYACGNKGLRGACDWYAAAVLREVR